MTRFEVGNLSIFTRSREFGETLPSCSPGNPKLIQPCTSSSLLGQLLGVKSLRQVSNTIATFNFNAWNIAVFKMTSTCGLASQLSGMNIGFSTNSKLEAFFGCFNVDMKNISLSLSVFLRYTWMLSFPVRMHSRFSLSSRVACKEDNVGMSFESAVSRVC